MAVEPDRTTTQAPSDADTPAPPDDTIAREKTAPDHAPARGALVAGSLALALGLAALVVALVLPLAVYPRVAVLPAEPAETVTSTANGATVLAPDPTSPLGLRVVRDVRLTSTTTIAPAPDRSKAGDDVVWQLTTTTSAAGIGPLGAPVVERVSMDPRTGRSTNCCGDRIGTSAKKSDSRPVRHQGYFAWPFDVAKRDYAVWDGTLGRPWTASFAGEEKRDGFSTYVFRSEVPRTQMGTVELPGALFERPEPVVRAQSWYSRTTTSWIEPSTGAPIARREQRTQEYSYAGRTVTAFSATMESEELSGARRDDVNTGARWLPWVRGRAAFVLVPLGLLLLAAGALLLRRRAAGRRNVVSSR